MGRGFTWFCEHLQIGTQSKALGSIRILAKWIACLPVAKTYLVPWKQNKSKNQWKKPIPGRAVIYAPKKTEASACLLEKLFLNNWHFFCWNPTHFDIVKNINKAQWMPSSQNKSEMKRNNTNCITQNGPMRVMHIGKACQHCGGKGPLLVFPHFSRSQGGEEVNKGALHLFNKCNFGKKRRAVDWRFPIKFLQHGRKWTETPPRWFMLSL